ncbi:hypothetical protein RJG79_09095 [Mycoplasmatota bacterium WC44]
MKQHIYLVLGVVLIILSSIVYMFEKWFVIYHWSIVVNKFNPFPTNPDRPNYFFVIVFFILGVALAIYHFYLNKED